MSAKTPHKVWSGFLSFGLVSMPVQLFTAAREEKLSFNQLHAGCNARLKQPPMTCSLCGVVPSKDQIVKGYEYDKNTFVTITAAEIEAQEPESARTMAITEFVSDQDVDPVYFESSFYLAASEGGEKCFALVREAMTIKGVVAIAKMVYSGKEHVCIVRAIPGGLMVHTLFWANEVRTMMMPRLPECSDAELSIAGQLIDALAKKWDPTRYHDSYRENMLALIDAKKQGTAIQAVTPRKPHAPIIDITAALAASVEKARAALAS